MTETIYLKKGDALRILPETKEFLLGCCKCNLVHLIKVKRRKGNVSLQFFRHKPKVDKIKMDKDIKTGGTRK